MTPSTFLRRAESVGYDIHPHPRPLYGQGHSVLGSVVALSQAPRKPYMISYLDQA